jgi:hypothetical protein
MLRTRVMVLGTFLLTTLSVATAQNVTPEQNKLLAKRAAEADAYRKLTETVYGLQINSTTFVKDFVTESDDIRTAVDAFIRGIRLGTPTWYEDGSCEVEAEVTVAKVIETLRSAHQRHYRGSSVKTSDFESITRRIEKDIIRAVGMGAPRPDLPPDLPEVALELLPPAPAAPPRPPIPDIWMKIGPQARLMALRAARADAMRQLAERIKGLRLTSTTQVRDFVTESDIITTEMQTTLVGAREVRQYLHDDELIAEVTMSVPTQQVITTIKRLHSRHYRGDDIRGHDIEDIVKRVIKKDFEATGMGVPPAQYIVRYEEVAQVELPSWVTSPVRAEGQGTSPNFETAQGRLMAARAAEVDAKRRLAEQIRGLTLTGSTLVRDFVTEHDEISTYVDAVIVNSHVVNTRFESDVAIVTVEIPGMRVWDVIGVEYRRITR